MHFADIILTAGNGKIPVYEWSLIVTQDEPSCVAYWLDVTLPVRLVTMVMPSFLNGIALICLGLGLMTFPLTVLPAGENIPAAAVLLFGLALTVDDGLLALFGLAAAGATAGH